MMVRADPAARATTDSPLREKGSTTFFLIPFLPLDRRLFCTHTMARSVADPRRARLPAHLSYSHAGWWRERGWELAARGCRLGGLGFCARRSGGRREGKRVAKANPDPRLDSPRHRSGIRTWPLPRSSPAPTLTAPAARLLPRSHILLQKRHHGRGMSIPYGRMAPTSPSECLIWRLARRTGLATCLVMSLCSNRL
jgi:hypothetical protein